MDQEDFGATQPLPNKTDNSHTINKEKDVSATSLMVGSLSEDRFHKKKQDEDFRSAPSQFALN